MSYHLVDILNVNKTICSFVIVYLSNSWVTYIEMLFGRIRVSCPALNIMLRPADAFEAKGNWNSSYVFVIRSNWKQLASAMY